MRNRLTVLEEAGRNKQSHLLLKCRCDCGNITITNKYRKPKSCGHCNLNKKFPKNMGICTEDKKSIDRKNNNGNYEKENCRWANSFEQNRNQSSNHAISF